VAITDRKLFRNPRPARDALNRMGGIMASSAPLMNEVQRFANGDLVQISPEVRRQLDLRDTARRMADQDRANRLSRMFGLGGQSPLEQDFASPDDMMMVPTPAPAAPASIEEAVAQQMTPEMMANADRGSRIASMLSAMPDVPTTGIANAGGAPSPMEMANADREARIRRVSEATAVPVLPGDAEDPAFESLPSEKLSDARLAALDAEDAADVRDMVVPDQKGPPMAEVSPDVRTRLAPDQKGPPMAEVSPDVRIRLAPDQKGPPMARVPASALVTDGDSKEDKVIAGESVVDSIIKEMQSGKGETDINDFMLEISGGKKPDQKLSREERIKQNVALYEKLFGESPEDQRSVDGFNLAYLGFAIAAGKDPNALVNIAEGAKAGVANMMKTKEARKDRKLKMKMLGVQEALADERAEIAWERDMAKAEMGYKYDWMKTEFKESQEGKRFVAKLSATKANLQSQLAQQLKIANMDDKTKREIADASTRASTLKTILGNYDQAGQLVYNDRLAKGLEPGTEEFQKGFNEEVIKISKSLETTKKPTALGGAVSRQVFIERSITDNDFYQRVEDQLREKKKAQGVKNPTVTLEEVMKGMGNFYDKVYASGDGFGDVKVTG